MEFEFDPVEEPETPCSPAPPCEPDMPGWFWLMPFPLEELPFMPELPPMLPAPLWPLPLVWAKAFSKAADAITMNNFLIGSKLSRNLSGLNRVSAGFLHPDLT